MKRLDFIGIGVQRTATTWVFRCLLEHPNVRGARVENDKELNFFNFNYYKGYMWYHSQFEFGSWKNGEFSVLYFNDRNVPKRIYQYSPEIKLLLCLRNPIDRAFSHHLHEIMRDRIPKHLYKFSDAIQYNPSYIEMGKYATLLESYFEIFDPSQIHVILYDEILSRPDDVIKNAFKYLEVDYDFRPSVLFKKVNVSHTYRYHSLEHVIQAGSNILRRVLGDYIHNAIRATHLQYMIRNFNKVEFSEKVVLSLSENERKDLYDIFAQEIERLGKLINRDLSHWK